MKKVIMAITMLLAPVLVNAEPIYLKCTTAADKDGSRVFEVKLDEATGKITHTGKEKAFNADGFFESNAISYKNVYIVDDVSQITTVNIDRTNLKVKIEVITEAVDPKKRGPRRGYDLDRGTCEIVEVKSRKI